MTATAFKMDARWAKLEKQIANASPTMKRHLRRANRLNGTLLQAKMREVITSGTGLESNKPLTVALKGENKPLVGKDNQLWQGIKSHDVSELTIFVGVIRSEGVYDLAEMLHEGVDIKVTPRMRGLFAALANASATGKADKLTGRAQELWEMMSGGWHALSPSTTVIAVPSRPFARLAFNDSGMKGRIKKNWEQAVAAAIKEVLEGSK